MVSSKLKPKITELAMPFASPIGRYFKPNHLTIIALILGIFAFFLISQGKIIHGAIFVLLSIIFDLLDGVVARTQKMVTDFGGFLDSVVDRYVEVLIFIAFGIYGLNWLLVAIAMSGSLLVSYTRARAEKIIERCDVGIAERGERMIILFLAMLSGYIYEGLILIAILAHLTAIHRVFYTYKRSKIN